MAEGSTLEQWLDSQCDAQEGARALSATLAILADGVRRLSAMIRQGDLIERPAVNATLRSVLENQAARVFRASAEAAPVAHLASADDTDVVTLDDAAPLALAIDPLDASNGLDGNVPTGTIFSIYPKAADPLASFLRPGREQWAAGYAMYGGRTLLVLTLGRGTAVFTLDPATDTFILTDGALTTPEDASAFAINAANYRHWEPPVRAYIDDCVEGTDGPRDKEFKMRWVGSLVAETHRILTQGGIFLYPRDNRPEHERGTLRRVFGAMPIALITEQAGGGATDGDHRLLDTVPASLHARAPLVFGSRKKVERVKRYHDDPDFNIAGAPLFGVRGLFRG
ncbi:class 1 fructose-bisphosphatase [Roseospira marina]|nr:class 1 fructose-bisphosphatase [Roseospira marina]MBB4312567.1 fructose-1,6-bisphosphatase I [Roseospira marina]MBB5085417.1 fructose-1,6-bisphosphatase I [Roseospira marina]